MVTKASTHVAQSMHLSQPAVSKLIADLEYAIGFKLFVRSKGSALTVTPEAEYFYHGVERSFIGVDALKKTADDIRNLSTGNLHIVSLPALAFSFLPHVIRAFQKRHPGVSIHLDRKSTRLNSSH